MRLAVGIVLAAIVAGSPAVGGVFGEFAKVWADRDAQYTAKKPSIDLQATLAHEQLIAAAKAGASDLKPQIIADTDPEHALGELPGRGVKCDVSLRAARRCARTVRRGQPLHIPGSRALPRSSYAQESLIRARR
jgi:hypothetical protein